MPNYAPDGQFSKAWWIQLVKDHGLEGGGTTALRDHSGTSYDQTKAAIDDLVGGGLY